MFFTLFPPSQRTKDNRVSPSRKPGAGRDRRVSFVGGKLEKKDVPARRRGSLDVPRKASGDGGRRGSLETERRMEPSVEDSNLFLPIGTLVPPAAGRQRTSRGSHPSRVSQQSVMSDTGAPDEHGNFPVVAVRAGIPWAEVLDQTHRSLELTSPDGIAAPREEHGEGCVPLSYPVKGVAMPLDLDAAAYQIGDFVTKTAVEGTMTSSQLDVKHKRSGLDARLTVHFKSQFRGDEGELQEQCIARSVALRAELRHPHLHCLYLAWEDEEHQYVLAEAVKHTSLRQVVKGWRGRVPEAAFRAEIAAPLTKVLALLHGTGYIHRNLHPEKVLFGMDGALKLGGLEYLINARRERPTARAGTVGYIAPEMMKRSDGARTLYAESVDVWSLGVLAYECLTGTLPFNSAQIKNMSRLIACGAVTFPQDSRLSEDCQDWVSKCLAYDPSDRPTACALLLHPWLGDLAGGFFDGTHDDDAVKLSASQAEMMALDAVSELRGRTGAARAEAVTAARELVQLMKEAIMVDELGVGTEHRDRLLWMLERERAPEPQIGRHASQVYMRSPSHRVSGAGSGCAGPVGSLPHRRASLAVEAGEGAPAHRASDPSGGKAAPSEPAPPEHLGLSDGWLPDQHPESTGRHSEAGSSLDLCGSPSGGGSRAPHKPKTLRNRLSNAMHRILSVKEKRPHRASQHSDGAHLGPVSEGGEGGGGAAGGEPSATLATSPAALTSPPALTHTREMTRGGSRVPRALAAGRRSSGAGAAAGMAGGRRSTGAPQPVTRRGSTRALRSGPGDDTPGMGGLAPTSSMPEATQLPVVMTGHLRRVGSGGIENMFVREQAAQILREKEERERREAAGDAERKGPAHAMEDFPTTANPRHADHQRVRLAVAPTVRARPAAPAAPARKDAAGGRAILDQLARRKAGKG